MSVSRPIVGAVYRNDYAALDELLKSGDVNSCDRDGTTPLMHAILADPPYPQMIEYLVEHGADVNAVEKGDRWTPLHFAARDQSLEIVKILLDHDAAVDPVDSSGNTPLRRCIASTYPLNSAVVDLLLAHGADPRRKNNNGASSIDVARRRGNPELLERLEQGRPSK